MTKITAGLSLALAFTLGCLAAQHVPDLAVPTSHAAAPAGVQQWEYNCETNYYLSLEKGSSLLDSLGAQGWELVGFAADRYCFKRPRSG